MDLFDLLNMYDVDTNCRIKLYRHSDGIEFLQKLRRDEKLEEYQAMQSKPYFNCDKVIVFLGMPQNGALFEAIYDVHGCRQLTPEELDITASKTPCWNDEQYHPPRLLRSLQPWWHGTKYIYNLKRTDEMAELSGRLIIKFGSKATQTSARWLQNFDQLPLVQIRADGQQQAFPGFENVRLSFQELEAIVNHREANQDWYHALSSVAGIYAICVTANNLSDEFDKRRIYIGSASGKDNLWQRWSEYVRTRHCGNKMLETLLKESPNVHLSFQFSIMQTAPLTMSKSEIVKLEDRYKENLQTRKFGLNQN